MSKQAPKLRGTIYGQKALDLKSQGLSLSQIKAELLTEGLEISPAALSKFFSSEAEKDQEAEAEAEPLEFDTAEAEAWIYKRMDNLLNFVCKGKEFSHNYSYTDVCLDIALGKGEPHYLEALADYQDEPDLAGMSYSRWIFKCVGDDLMRKVEFVFPFVQNIAKLEYLAYVQTEMYFKGEISRAPTDKIEFAEKLLEKLCKIVKDFS
jgi:catalase (peroxidase I)